MGQSFDSKQKPTPEETPVSQGPLQPFMKRGMEPAIKRGMQPMYFAKSKKNAPEKTLPDPVKEKMENSFGEDFSGVQIHSDSEKARELGAKAYAQGNDLHFAPGEFQPETKEGQELLGHELAHVVQQKEGTAQGGSVQGKDIVNQDPSLEQEADEAGKMASEGKEVRVSRGTWAGSIQKQDDDKLRIKTQNDSTETSKQISANDSTNSEQITLNKITIENSVGLGGINNPEDVLYVQTKLFNLEILAPKDFEAEMIQEFSNPINEDKIKATIAAINKFQKILFKGKSFNIIKPGMQTIEKLNSLNKIGLQQLTKEYSEYLNNQKIMQNNASQKTQLPQFGNISNTKYKIEADNTYVQPKNHTRLEFNTEIGRVITEADYIEAAKGMGVEVEVLKAIAANETKSIGGFLKDGRATILFERHLMYSKLKSSGYDMNSIPDEDKDIINKKSGGYGSYTSQYLKLERAKKYNADLAIESASWGRFQVLGETYKWGGFKNPQELEAAMQKSEYEQFKYFVAFLKNKGEGKLILALKNHEWEKVASLYNGRGWKKINPDYAKLLKKHYEEYKK